MTSKEKLIGTVRFIFKEHGPGDPWTCEMQPEVLPNPHPAFSDEKNQMMVRHMYKLGMIVSSMQKHAQDNLTNIDRLLDMALDAKKLQAAIDAKNHPKPKAVPDTEKYQQPLPFKEEDTDNG